MSRCGGSCAGATCERSRPAPGGHPAARRHSIRSRDGASRLKALYDADELFEFQYGDGRTRLIERLAVAYRDGELPDYMLEFVDSLRTRATHASS